MEGELSSRKPDGISDSNRALLSMIKEHGVRLSNIGGDIHELEIRMGEFDYRCDRCREELKQQRQDKDKDTVPEINRWALKGWAIVAAAVLGALGTKIAQGLF